MNIRLHCWTVIAVLAPTILGALSPSALDAAEIKVLSSNAMTDVVSYLVPEFERRTGHSVTVTFEPTTAIMNRINGGETADVIILIRQSIDDLKKAGKLVSDTDSNLARTSLGLAVKAGAPRPDISTPEALKLSLLDARVVVASEVGASGIQFRRVIDQLGIAEQMKSKLKLLPGTSQTATLVANGTAEIAVQMMSELKTVPGAEIIGPFPGKLHYEILLTAALDARAREPAAGRQLIEYLASPETAQAKADKGMQAGGG